MENKSAQDKILESKDQRIVVLACPGSGKTTTLTKKIIKLYKEGVPLKKILAVTFTRKAAQEMLERISKEINVSKGLSRNICTLHSFGFKILNTYKDVVGLKEDFTIATKEEKENIINAVFGTERNAEEFNNSFLEYVSSIKNGFEVNKYSFTMEQFDSFCKKMIETNLIDMDDFIYLPIKILSNHPMIKEKISHQYDYVYVDEYQDINQTQNDLLDLIIYENTHVLLVGDDDQSIYEFRGSNPNYILEKSSPNSGYTVFYLTTNYRSQKPIVELSKKVLEFLSCEHRREKKIVAFKDKSAIKPVRMPPFEKKEDETNYVIEEIYRLITQSSVEPKEIAVLCRYTSKKGPSGQYYHPELIDIKNGLIKRGIPASMSMTMDKDNAASKTIKNLCNILLSLSKKDFRPEVCNLVENASYRKKSFDEIVKEINFDFHTDFQESSSFEEIMDFVLENESKMHFVGNNERKLTKLIQTYRFIKEQRNLIKNGQMPSETISNLIAYYIKKDSIYTQIQEIYEAAFAFAKASEDAFEKEQDEEINEYVEIVQSMNAFLCEKDESSNKNSVRLLTAHQSKGLQFDVVFVVGLEVGSFPCNIDELNEQNLDNERRLFYVSITRAKELLYLTSTKNGYESLPEFSDKSFIYTLPNSYFSTKIDSFSEVDFSIVEKETDIRLREKNRLIDELEEKYLLAVSKLESDSQLLSEIQSQNNALLEQVAEKKGKMATLENEVTALRDKLRNAQDCIEELNHSIDDYRQNENEYRKQIRALESLPDSKEVEKEKQELEDKLQEQIQGRKQLEEKVSRLQEQLEKQKQEREKDKVEFTKANEQEKKALIESQASKVEAGKKQVQKTMEQQEQLLSTLIGLPNDIVPPEMKEMIKEQYKVFILNARYSYISNYFMRGLSAFIDIVNDMHKFLNGGMDKLLFKNNCRSTNFKMNLIVVIRKILSICSSYKEINNNDFSVCGFLYAYLGEKDPATNQMSSFYLRMVRNYNVCSFSRIISRDLAHRLIVFYSVSNIGNHEGKNITNPHIENYHRIADHFFNSLDASCIKTTFSYFEILDLFMKQDTLLMLCNQELKKVVDK